MRRRDFLAGGLGALSSVAIAPIHTLAQGKLSWTDVHMHVIGGPQRAFGPAVIRALEQMDARGIAKAMILPPPLPQALFDHPDYVAELKRYPGRFGFLGGGGLLNPMLQQFTAGAVTSAVRQHFVDTAKQILDAGAAGFGEIAVLHLSLTPNHPFEQAAPDHPLMQALVETAGRAGVVIDLHMDAVAATTDAPVPAGFQVPPNLPRLAGNIAGLERLLAHERNARIVWAHGGSDLTGDQKPGLIRRLMDTHANLYMSLRPVPPPASGPFGLKFHNKIFTESGLAPEWRELLAAHSDRFVLGGDTFFLGAPVPGGAAEMFSRGNEARLNAAAMLLARLPPATARKIATENATRLYRI